MPRIPPISIKLIAEELVAAIASVRTILGNMSKPQSEISRWLKVLWGVRNKEEKKKNYKENREEDENDGEDIRKGNRGKTRVFLR